MGPSVKDSPLWYVLVDVGYNFFITRHIKSMGQNLRIYILIFLNSDFTIDIASILTIFLGYVPHSPPEGIVSLFFNLGPG